MFQLIVAVISIALVAALAIASIYYGGQAFERSGAKAAADTILNGAQQVSGATALYRVDNSGGDPSAMTDLLNAGPNGAYLSSLPTLPAGTGPFTLVPGTTGVPAVVTATTTPAVCTAMAAPTGGAYSCDATGAFSFTL